MNASRPSLYERIARTHIAAFNKGCIGGYEGPENAAALVVCTKQPSETAHGALEASFARLGYGAGSLGWVRTGRSDEGENERNLLFELIEAIDPLCVVSLSREGATLLSRSYNTPLALEAKTLLLGRECCCFDDFEALLSTEAGKHKAWKLLKSLPKLAG